MNKNDESLILGGRNNPPSPLTDIPDPDRAVLEAELKLMDEVAQRMFPLCLQVTIHGGLATGQGQQMNWNIPVAALNAYNAAGIFLDLRRQVREQYPEQRRKSVALFEAAKAKKASESGGKPN